MRKRFEELTGIDKMILALKGAIEEVKRVQGTEEEMLLGAFIYTTVERLKAKGLSKEDIMNYRVNI